VGGDSDEGAAVAAHDAGGGVQESVEVFLTLR
jgi:hypothetical protein